MHSFVSRLEAKAVMQQIIFMWRENQVLWERSTCSIFCHSFSCQWNRHLRSGMSLLHHYCRNGQGGFICMCHCVWICLCIKLKFLLFCLMVLQTERLIRFILQNRQFCIQNCSNNIFTLKQNKICFKAKLICFSLHYDLHLSIAWWGKSFAVLTSFKWTTQCWYWKISNSTDSGFRCIFQTSAHCMVSYYAVINNLCHIYSER